MESPLRTCKYTGTTLLDVPRCGHTGLRAGVSWKGREEVRGAEHEQA